MLDKHKKENQAQPQPPSPPKGNSWLFIGAGSMFTAMILVGFILGYGVDVWLGTNPLFMLILGLMGFIGGILRLIRVLT
ncbi:MAG: AtpZ/AtpI family protein [Candidatus Oxydemutatoraceae bacterium WSBS_2016_MAG_OTU14]